MSGKREKILRTALALFARFGYKKTSVDEIANQSDIAKGTVYLYFKNKEDILFNVIQDMGKSYFENIEHMLSDVHNPIEKLRAYIKAVASFHKEKVQQVEITFEQHFEMEKLTNELTTIGNAFRDIINKDHIIFVGLLQEGIDAGYFEIKDIEATASIIRNALDAINHLQFPIADSIETKRKIDALTDVVVNGVLTRKKY